jgi:hypothetical protein
LALPRIINLMAWLFWMILKKLLLVCQIMMFEHASDPWIAGCLDRKKENQSEFVVVNHMQYTKGLNIRSAAKKMSIFCVTRLHKQQMKALLLCVLFSYVVSSSLNSYELKWVLPLLQPSSLKIHKIMPT